MLRRIFVLLCLLFASQAVAQTCGPSSPCETGCCNEFGSCGFGPDFCGDDTCISDCKRKSECNPGFGKEWAERDKCPLNVCCSKYGFCGTTKEFCGDKKVSHKTCSKSNGNERIIGYYEGWANERPCNVFWPEQIPIGLYTHINFAFANIDPETFKVVPGSHSDINLYKRVVYLKQRDPDLKVFIAIGGWAFNDPGPTQTTFSDLAASVPRQKVFIESLMSFMSTYGFDGVDLDWEYPVADDRAGREVDFDNFPEFMSRLKSALSSSAKGISITIPASYWYLQHFDLKALAKSVSWFNIMSYDLHGTWDKGNKWTGSFLNAHTNLTEIKDALDLIWRNDISPTQVVMGLGFYGRSFTASSPSCLEPSCTFESGGESGKCSREIGILLNSEIDEIVEKNSIKPKFYEKEAVKVASWGNQWVAYDDADTFKLKSEFAQSQCLGGLMVWAISHDTKDAKYNKALAKVANRKITTLPILDGSEPYQFVKIPNAQCKWTNCGESCPSGWIHMTREDDGARGKEYMLDESGCGGIDMAHAFCCPPGEKLPTCGWYTHHNGACDNECPSGTVEIGSNDKYCRQKYQAACCTTDTKSMRLYSRCEWGEYPICDSQEGCPDSSKDTLLAASSTGSGAAHCNLRGISSDFQDFWVQQRKYCCDTSDEDQSFSDCEWYDGIGYGLGTSEYRCRSGCPNDRVRIAMDGSSELCEAGGSRSRCCVPKYSDTIEVENPKLDSYRDAVTAYMMDPTCAKPGPILERELLDGGALARRADNKRVKETEALLLALITKAGTSSMLEAMAKIWNDHVGDKFPNLKFDNFRSWATDLPEYGTEGPMQMSHSIVCSPNYWNARVGAGGSGSESLVDCSEGICETEDCGGDESLAGRSLAAHLSAREKAWSEAPADLDSALAKRASSRTYTANLVAPDGTRRSITITLPAYPGIVDLEPNDPMNDEAVDFLSRGDCTNSRLAHFSLGTGETFHMEHVFDAQLIRRFMEDAAAGNLRSGAAARSGPVAISYFVEAQTMVLPNPPPIPGGADHDWLYGRVMESLGSNGNRANFVVTHENINTVKANLMQGKNPIAKKRLPGLAQLASPVYVLTHLRASIGVIRYLNYQDTPNVNQRLTNVLNAVGKQWQYGQDTWNAKNPTKPVAIADFWREWTEDFFTWLIIHTQNFVESGITQMRRYWGVSTSDAAPQVLEILRSMEDELKNLDIDTRGLDD